jgi:cephalosporin hydroxylase
MLISKQKPKTIVEIGSANGGSAKWFAAICRGLGLETRIYSLDIDPVRGLDEANLTFLEGNIYNLADSQLVEIMKNATHPILVVEDGPHLFEACLASLEFFDPFLSPGD